MYVLRITSETGYLYWGETPDGWKGWTRRRDQALRFDGRQKAEGMAAVLIDIEMCPAREKADAT